MRGSWLYLARAWTAGAALWACFVLVRLPLRIMTGVIPAQNALTAFRRGWLFGLPFILLAPAFHQLVQRVLRRTISPGRAVAAALFLLFVVAVTEPAAMLAFGIRTEGVSYRFIPFAVGRAEANVLAFIAAVAATMVLIYRYELQRARLRSARLQTQLLEARLQVLLLQLQPHFLFNTLNSIAELVHRDVARARQILARLGELVRSTFDRPGTQVVTVAEEADWLRAYAEIQETRFADALTIDFAIDPAVRGALLPRLLMQPLLENAVRHGIGQGGRGGRVLVQASRAGERLALRVVDNGAGFASGGVREGVGLSLTRRRLEQLHGGDARLSLESSPGGGTTASIDLPLRLAVGAIADERSDAAADPPGEALIPTAGTIPLTTRRIALGIAVAWVLVFVAGFPATYAEYAETLRAGGALGAAAARRALEIAPWVLATPFIVGWSRWAALRVRNPVWLAASHLGVGGAAVAGQQAAFRALGVILPSYPPAWVAAYLVGGAMVYVAIAGASHVWAMQHRYAEESLAAAVLARDLAQAELDAMGWRMQPDFIADVLDDIGALAGTDARRADALTVALGDLMRVMLDGAGAGGTGESAGRQAALGRCRAALDELRQPARFRSA